MYYLEVFSALKQYNVKYLLVGGVAVVLHGVLRLTADLDLIVQLEKENLSKFVEAMKILGYTAKVPANPTDLANPEIREEWIKNKNMKVFSFINEKVPYKLIDIFVNEPIPFDEAYARRQIVKAKDVEISVISFDDLISLKKMASRPQDLEDINMLEELKNDRKI